MAYASSIWNIQPSMPNTPCYLWPIGSDPESNTVYFDDAYVPWTVPEAALAVPQCSSRRNNGWLDADRQSQNTAKSLVSR
ncbi:hypothetical protein HBI45_097030 [Parastagonospora nodorum]|nr:hypothetical protein HBI45_097030 [Parastagonospora nodorum]